MGPTKIITETLVCDGCPNLVLKDWKFYGENDEIDSGTSATCAQNGKRIDAYWHKGDKTPDWCPALSTTRKEGE